MKEINFFFPRSFCEPVGISTKAQSVLAQRAIVRVKYETFLSFILFKFVYLVSDIWWVGAKIFFGFRRRKDEKDFLLLKVCNIW